MAGDYASCEWIEGGVAFNRRSLHTCLVVHHRTGLPFVADYDGGAIAFDTLFALREQIRTANREGGGHPECRGCPHLRVGKWPRAKYPIEIVGIAHYAYCNIKCSYCFLQTQDPASFAAGMTPYSLMPAITSLIRDGHLAPRAIIDWGGGEPTSYPEFDQLLAVLLDHGTFHYIHTNGTRFPAAVSRAPRRVHVICSVDAGLPATYVRIKQKDYLERVWRVLEQYVRAGVRVSLKYIVKEENCGDGDLEAFTDRAVRIRAHELIMDIDYDFPVPAPAVIAALGRLKAMACVARLPARFGFTGANFAPEHDVAGRVEGVFRDEWLLRRGGFLTRILRRARGVTLGRLARRLLPSAAHAWQVPTPETKDRPDATTQTRPDQPGGVGRRVWHLPVTNGD
jgi:pyruvate-formate lyase-activating enzyme